MPPLTLPYCGPVPTAQNIWAAWNFDPILIAALILCLGVGHYAGARRWPLLLGWGVLVVAFVSPLCALTVAFFTARSVHHLVIVTLAAPLLAMASPMRGRGAQIPFMVLAAVLVLWHLPPVYTMLWDNHAIYWLMQIALLASAWAFWSRVARQDPQQLAASALLTAGLAGVMGLIGAIITFAPRVLFEQHITGALGWGIDPLYDQQMAGLVMWVPGMLPLAIVAGLLIQRAWVQSVQS
ncbi:cytochrome c oxidase assembly protein [Ketogulonicigenium vulgare]|uniref:Cytochrome c oxidase assembly protein n=1 Tax=Ketogulonicigenium vulgare (strain WSH-001) TaxID=759362 RepID=F9Y910_KETVW|nr:cytochrome c oxidase assembly protein [Ketogulonicigenium vulgare]ADO41841.1 conserved hypothetical protein [Ketogulonicigenium vulgare Y25]AEM40066.1 hypothetical protein KVU_0227 [Ketogulonicigenium vulgare WSH-001]ALJ80269.1 hypothetical protein KVH_03210 [Ketogulonicigenium vulgare]ANW33124.1 hypothetical protein KvSKV_03205 [Ketogulonicigenium vulgare]AOZ53764.1 cytochrome c oxidase caa3 assembly factor family protein [Ketogulonicigenium vulgare]